MPTKIHTETLDGNGTQWLSFAHGPKVAIVSLTIDGLEIPSLDGMDGLRVGYMLLRDGLYLHGYLFTQNPQNVVVTYTAGKQAVNDAARADQIDEAERYRRALERIEAGFINSDLVLANPPDWRSAFNQLQGIARVALAAKAKQ